MDSSSTVMNEDTHMVELVTTNNQPSEEEEEHEDTNQITPLLSTHQSEITNSNKPKINIFTVSYPRKKSNKVFFIYLFIFC